ncbi:hypothetical protein BGX20_008553 [Mortierella sp. AD010]|nr:hypothetical protein BGX20_008553 [Mortierella sp. AD010]
MSSAYNRVFAIPNIVECISHSLDFKTITAAARVCRAWHTLWLPIIWHTIDCDQQWQDDFMQVLSQHGDLIRILRCSRDDNISPLISDPTLNNNDHQCRNLVTLVMPKTTLVNQSDQVKLIRQNPGLRDLSLAFRDDPSSDYSDLIHAIGDHDFASGDARDHIATQFIPERAILRRIGFFLNHPIGYAYASSSKLLATSKTEEQTTSACLPYDVSEQEEKKFLGITSLCMDDVACSQDLILNLASRFPNLEKLSLQLTAELYFSKDFSSRLAQRSPHIKWLNVSKTEDMDDSTIAALVRSFPGLRTLIAGQTGFSEMSLYALIECCPDLEELDIRETYGLESESVQRLLQKCRSLKSLNAWDTSVNVPKMIMEAYRSQSTTGEDHPVLFPTRAHSSEVAITGLWACHGLESLTLNFCYDRSSLSDQEQRLIPPASARRYLLEQLSRLTNLRNLSIRTTYYDSSNDSSGDDDTTSTIEETNDSEFVIQRIQQDMSLLVIDNLNSAGVIDDNKEDKEEEYEGIGDDVFNIVYSMSSGLGVLCPLKQLRSLILTGVHHAVGLDEIRWMCDQWPKLNRIEGLYWDEDWDEDRLVLSWLQENRPGLVIEEGDDDEEC